MLARQRADELVSPLQLTILGEETASVASHRRSARPCVDEQAAPAAVAQAQRGSEGERTRAPGQRQLEEVRLGAARRIGPEQRVVDDADLLDRQGLYAKVERAGLTRGVHPCLHQPEILVEDRVLQRNRKGQQTVEPALDRRQVLAQSSPFGFKREA